MKHLGFYVSWTFVGAAMAAARLWRRPNLRVSTRPAGAS